MARLHDLVFDCAHPAATARFWAAVMEDYAVAPYDDEELARRALGTTDVTHMEERPNCRPCTDSWGVARPVGGGGPRVQRAALTPRSAPEAAAIAGGVAGHAASAQAPCASISRYGLPTAGATRQ